MIQKKIHCIGCGKLGTTIYCADCAKKLKCPHGNKPGECSHCDVEGDLAYDANRERGR